MPCSNSVHWLPAVPWGACQGVCHGRVRESHADGVNCLEVSLRCLLICGHHKPVIDTKFIVPPASGMSATK